MNCMVCEPYRVAFTKQQQQSTLRVRLRVGAGMGSRENAYCSLTAIGNAIARHFSRTILEMIIMMMPMALARRDLNVILFAKLKKWLLNRSLMI